MTARTSFYVRVVTRMTEIVLLHRVVTRYVEAVRKRAKRAISAQFVRRNLLMIALSRSIGNKLL